MRQFIILGLIIVIVVGVLYLEGNAARGEQVFLVCHGEFESRCKQHPYTVFEHCGADNGVGGANPTVSGKKLCGNDKFEAASADGGSISGNHCGYSWFRIICK
jgi:hypothetical protein